jgi:hypothetical protein
MVLLPLHGSVAGLGYSEELTIQVVLRDSCCVFRDLSQAQATNQPFGIVIFTEQP